jgi:Ca2+/Na+ antiporter
MKDTGETWSTASDSDQNARSEYRFIYNRAEIRKGFFNWVVAFLIVCVLYLSPYFSFSASFSDQWERAPTTLFPAAILFLLPGFWLICLLRIGITISQGGMTCTGYWYSSMPRYCAWDEFSKIRTDYPKGQRVSRMLVFFISCSTGLRYFCLDVCNRKRQYYVGVGHSLSLEEAIERFTEPVEVFSDAEKSKLPLLIALNNPGKKERHIAYMAFGIALFTITLIALRGRPHLLDNLSTPVLYWTLGLGAGAIAYWYMRHIKHKAAMIFWAIFLGSMVTLMLFPLKSYIPLWFGKEERIVFSVSEESYGYVSGGTIQHWQATTEPELTLLIYAPSDNLTYKGEGTERPMTVYRGPWSLNALPAYEYRALFRENR